MRDRVVGPCFFSKSNITAYLHLDMLQIHAASQLEDFQSYIVFQQGGIPPQRRSCVRQFLNEAFLNR